MIHEIAVVSLACVLAYLCYKEYKIHRDPLIYSAILVMLTALVIFFLIYK